MKDTFSKLLTPLVAMLAGAGTFFVAKGYIAEEFGQAINEAGAQVGAGIVGFVALVMTALVTSAVRKFSRKENDGEGHGGGTGGGALPLIAVLSTAAGFGFFLPSCSPNLRWEVETPHGRVDYSRDRGVKIETPHVWEAWPKSDK